MGRLSQGCYCFASILTLCLGEPSLLLRNTWSFFEEGSQLCTCSRGNSTAVSIALWRLDSEHSVRYEASSGRLDTSWMLKYAYGIDQMVSNVHEQWVWYQSNSLKHPWTISTANNEAALPGCSRNHLFLLLSRRTAYNTQSFPSPAVCNNLVTVA